MILILRTFRIPTAVALLLLLVALRAAGGDSVFDRLRREHSARQVAEPQADAMPADDEPQSLSTPPTAQRLERARLDLLQDEAFDEGLEDEEPPEPPKMRLASAQLAVEDSPYFSPPPPDFHLRGEPPIAINVETEYIDDEYGFDDHHDFERRPRLFDRVCELYTFAKRPMQGQSWLSRPLSAGLEFGGIWGGELIEDSVTMSSGTLVMGTFGFDRGNYDGYEIRFGGSTIDTFNRRPPLDPRNTRLGVFDFSALLYPWGDSRLRPFARFGIGLHKYTFVDHEGREIDNIIPAGVIGVGVKYLFDRHLAVRMEFVDNIGFGDGLDLEVLHSPSLTFGAEFRFGGHQKLYWPWHSGRMIW